MNDIRTPGEDSPLRSSPPPTVLAVDDRVENLAALREALKGMELRLVEATSGREALGILLRERPAVILMDVNMPEMDGFETARLIHGNAATATVPIIFLTASDPDSSLTFTGYATGAVDYLHKPINQTILRSKVQVFLDLQGQQRKLERTLSELEELNRTLEQRVHERALALRESERRFSVAMQQSPVGMAVVSLEREWLEVNESLTRILGYRREELVGRKVDEIVHADDLATAQEWTATVLAGDTRGYEHEKRLIHKAGFPVWVRAGAALIRGEEGEPRYFVMQHRDVTESRLVRAAMECVASELTGLEGAAYLETMARCIADVFGGDIGFIAEPLRNTPGTVHTMALVERGDVAGEIAYPLAGTPCADVLSEGACVVPRDVQRLYPDDEYLQTVGAEAYAAMSFSDPDGGLLGHVGVISSVPLSVSVEGIEHVLSVFTQTLTATLVKERERERFVKLFELAPDALIKVDQDGVIRLVNHTAEQLFQWPREELIGQSIETLVPAAARNRHVRLRSSFAEEGGQRPMAVGLPNLRGVKRDGTEFPVEVSLGSLETADGAGVVASVRDMSERDQLEGQLRQAQKMESVGRLAAGVAHDFNNVLSVINTTAELAAGVATDESVREDLGVIRDAAQEAANLTAQLLALSRRQAMRAKLTDLNEVVRKAEPLVRRALGERVALSIQLADDVPSVVLDPGLFQQVIMNLAVNARDAITDKGTVTIETSAMTLDETYERTHVGVGTGPHALLSISDTGSGMDRETQEKIFEPFFTTKEPGKGTGLGMSTVYGIVKQVNGDIRVYSELDVGTTFKIYVPVSDLDPPLDEETDSAGAGVAVAADVDEGDHGPRRVLVVDDDPKVLRSVKRILDRAGYEVIAVEDPEAALRLVNEGDVASIDLLVSDVVMPRMNGQELADAVRAAYPDVKVLFSSGYTGETISQRGLLMAGFELISKPYSVEELTVRVREVLGR